ncbi:hypothetical protein [Psychroserpens ponticola]|uniref:Kazal-like domain-containing protein n=1 Tax=Psychroserpens ponticola TaxID=2932268 RepID=A0ABY7RZQ5_9FLAO|nr:hypothetical protein [Psychroserpens ponticola]WCO02618.1 hypothetical protein MUN68_003770 [Psychroserpens ponticola]
MKNLKLFLLSFALIAGLFTSCSNNDSVVNEQNIDETEAITQSLNRLAEQFNDEGYVIASENPSGNIVFDFCFDFVYPLNLAYNNGTTVGVSSLDDLITILINSTDDLYISGVEFPFNVETYNDSTGAIEIVTINNENEFFDVLENCDFDGIDTCDCDDVADPVCVEVLDPNGNSFIITYPNECLALCDGFTPNDFAENCEDDYNCPGGNECFDFNFPITIITDDNQTVTVNSQEELDSALYNAYYFDFVYPFEVTTEEGNLIVLENEEAFISLLEECYNINDCPCPTNVNPVCVEIETPSGDIEIISFLNACEAECAGFTDADFVDCETQQEICNEQEIIQNLIECTWFGNVSLMNSIVGYDFNIDGTVTLIGTAEPANGTWSVVRNEQNGEVYMYLDLPEPYNVISNLDWTVITCEEDMIRLESGDESIIFDRDCNVNNPNECSEQELYAYLLQCNWYFTTSLYNNVNAELAQFFQSGIVEITSQGTNQTIDGDWWLTSNPSQGLLFMSFNIPSSPYEIFSQYDWFVTQCSEEFILLESGNGNEFIQLERNCN